jgi:uncharacterized cupredoxin-like copper-binding protein
MKRKRLQLLSALLVMLASSCAPVTGPTHVAIRFHYSHFEPDLVTVPAGVPVTITLQNDDPIDHEWIVGSPTVHETHRHGTEAVHNDLPTEVSVPALSTKTTTVAFDAHGNLAFICHLPGHEEYGMSGLLRAR